MMRMRRKLSPKQSFLLLCLSTAALVVGLWSFHMLQLMGRAQEPPDSLWDLFLFFFPLVGILVIPIAVFLVAVAIPKIRIALVRLEVPKKYSSKHFLLLLWLTAGACLVGAVLHNVIYALGTLAFGADVGDEPFFFMIALFVVPVGIIVGAIGKIWEWAVIQPINEMKVKGIQLPTVWSYFAPIRCYVWLWKFSKGIEVITKGRMGARRVFAAVFILGIVGFVIVRILLKKKGV